MMRIRYWFIGILEKIRNKDFNYYSLNNYYLTKSLFVHIPKTGGVSVNKSLYYSLGGGHSKITDYQDLLGESKFNTFYKFVIIREPLERFLSAANYVFSGGAFESDEIWLNSCGYRHKSLNYIVQNHMEELVENKVHFFTQYDFIHDETGNSLCDDIFLFDNLETAFIEICHKLNVKRKLDYQNRTNYKLFELSDINPSSMEIINRTYAMDFELYNKIKEEKK